MLSFATLTINKTYMTRIKLRDIVEIDLTKPTSKKKRNKLIIALLAPILLILLIAGWFLYKRKGKAPKGKTNT
jgi:hypothetical protein